MANKGMTLQDGIDFFRVYCRAKGLAPRTIETYLFSLERLSLFLDGGPAASPFPSHHELRAFIAHMLGAGLSRQSIRVRMRSIRCFCNFLEREGVVDESPMKHVEIPRVPEPTPTVLTDEQMVALLAAVSRRSWHGRRDYTIFMTFLDTGVRLSELISLDLDDLDLRRGSLLVRNGKGGKSRTIYAGHTLRRALRQWLDVRGVSSACPGSFITARQTRYTGAPLGESWNKRQKRRASATCAFTPMHCNTRLRLRSSGTAVKCSPSSKYWGTQA